MWVIQIADRPVGCELGPKETNPPTGSTQNKESRVAPLQKLPVVVVVVAAVFGGERQADPSSKIENDKHKTQAPPSLSPSLMRDRSASPRRQGVSRDRHSALRVSSGRKREMTSAPPWRRASRDGGTPERSVLSVRAELVCLPLSASRFDFWTDPFEGRGNTSRRSDDGINGVLL